MSSFFEITDLLKSLAWRVLVPFAVVIYCGARLAEAARDAGFGQ